MSVSRKEKVVQFDDCKTRIRIMRVWDFASRQARVGTWMQDVRDRSRFEKRIREIGERINYVLIKKYKDYVNNKTVKCENYFLSLFLIYES